MVCQVKCFLQIIFVNSEASFYVLFALELSHKCHFAWSDCTAMTTDINWGKTGLQFFWVLLWPVVEWCGSSNTITTNGSVVILKSLLNHYCFIFSPVLNNDFHYGWQSSVRNDFVIFSRLIDVIYFVSQLIWIFWIVACCLAFIWLFVTLSNIYTYLILWEHDTEFDVQAVDGGVSSCLPANWNFTWSLQYYEQ